MTSDSGIEKERKLQFDIARQPDNVTCGPTCLHALYQYFGDDIPLHRVIAETSFLEQGGTLGALLACHALRRGYDALIYTFDMQMFDPTWFRPGGPNLAERIQCQMEAKESSRLRIASAAYLDFLKLGGRLRMEDMTATLIRKYLKRSRPILAGLSATYLYQEPRESNPGSQPDDVRGYPQGHFVVLCGYSEIDRRVLVADPMQPNPFAKDQQKYEVALDRLICAIMLGIVTYDANLVILQPKH